MAPTPPGYTLWEWTTPLTQAASPLQSPWIDTAGYTQVVPFFIFAGGTSTVALQGAFDGATADADFGYSAPTSGTAFTVLSPYIRFRLVQATADATRTKACVQARA